MIKKDVEKLEMFSRVRDFGGVNRDLFPESSSGGQAFAAVTEAVSTIEASASKRLLARMEVKRVTARMRAALREQLQALARGARGMAVDEERMVNAFQMPARRSDHALVSTARAYLDEMSGREVEFGKMGLPTTFATDTRALVDAFESATANRRQGRRELAAARAAQRRATLAGARAIRQLDAIVVNTLRGDAERLAAWHDARRPASHTRRRVDEAPTSASPPDAPAAPKDAAGAGEEALKKVS